MALDRRVFVLHVVLVFHVKYHLIFPFHILFETILKHLLQSFKIHISQNLTEKQNKQRTERKKKCFVRLFGRKWRELILLQCYNVKSLNDIFLQFSRLYCL